MGLTKVTGGGIQPTILDPIQNLYTGSTVVFTVTVASKDTTHRYNGQGSSNGYKIDGKFAPFLVLTPGVTYKFDQADGSNSGHPLRFYKDAAKVTAYTTNVTTNGTAGSSGAYTQIVTGDATPTILYYQCSAHGYMGNAVQTNGLASSVPDDGSITTAKLANDAVTTAKIADQAVTLSKLPHGTSSNNGKFLRANNGADPSFETVSIPAGTTINGNTDNRIITATGTANTLQGEENLTFNGSVIHLNSQSGGLPRIRLQHSGAGNDVFEISSGLTGISNSGFGIYDVDASAYRFSIDSSGRIGIGTNTPSNLLHVKGSGHDKLLLETTGTAHSVGVQMKHASGDAAEQTWQLQTNGGASTQRDLSVRDATAGTFIATFRKGGGITFNGDTAAANALDEYEEGTCAPNFQPASGSYGIGYQSGHYTRIGDIVHLTASISVNGATNASGEVQITGLPFSVRGVNSTWSGEGGHGVGRWFYGGFNHYVLLVCDNSTDRIRVHADGGTFLNHTNMSTGYNQSQFSFTITYFTDA